MSNLRVKLSFKLIFIKDKIIANHVLILYYFIKKESDLGEND